MTKSDLIRNLAEQQPKLSYHIVEKAIKELFDYMIKSLCAGHRIEVRGFGCFTLRFRPARVARNPKTGNIVATASKYVVYFRPGKELKLMVNDNKP